MPQGLEVYDPNGSQIISITDRLTKILGTLVIPDTVEEESGSLSVPDLASGTPFFFTTGNECKKDGFRDSRGWSHGFYGKDDGSFYPAFEIPAYQIDVSFVGAIMNWHVKKYSQWWVGIKNNSIQIHYGVY